MSTTTEPALGAALALLERVLRAGAPYAAECPLVFDARAPGRVIEIKPDGVVRSACTLLERELVMPHARIRAGFIGSVVTDPDHRGRGLATQVLEAAETELRSRGSLLALLWPNEPSFYERRGWRAIGAERDFVLSPTHREALPEAAQVRLRVSDDDDAIHELYALHPERVERTREETRALLGCPDMEVLVCERWGKTVAYSCLGRGADFHDVVHEWAGDARAVLALLRGHLERRRVRGEENDLYVIAPRSALDLAERLSALSVPSSIGVLGYAKMLDLVSAAEHLAGLIDRRGNVRVEVPPDAPGTIELVGSTGRWRGTNADVLELLFAARGDASLARKVAAAVGGTAERLPLALFAWGLDSI
ncbi:MAG: GNAT family N-acetyltransferase [Planctomycetota bacterium]